MCENVKLSCSCDIGIDKGVLKKTIENNIFTIYGNLIEKNSIVLRYHGPLTDNVSDNSTTLNIIYFFDSLENDKTTLPLDKCTKSIGECYCTNIDLKNFNKLHFAFVDSNGVEDKNCNKYFELEIKKDPIASILQRYGFEENKQLPICDTKKEDNLNIFKTLIEHIKSMFTKKKSKEA